MTILTTTNNPQQTSLDTEAAFFNTLRQITAEIAAQSNISSDLSERFIKNIATLKEQGNYPDQIFNYISRGSFKECYNSGLPGWVVKFCTQENNTKAERSLIEAAKRFQCDDLFVPTYFINLPFNFFAKYIDRDCTPCSDYSSNSLSGSSDCLMVSIQLQPIVEIACETEYTNIFHFKTGYRPQVYYNDGRVVDPFALELMDLGTLEWVKAAVATYGDEKFRRFLEFADEQGLSDLHAANIGYIDKGGDLYPVIIDWISE